MGFRNGKFGLLTVRYKITPDIFYCDCKCGNELRVWRSQLANLVQLDCGMCRRIDSRGRLTRTTVHGHMRHYKTRDGRGLHRATNEYNSWSQANYRCTSAKHHAWADYGGRGIRMCERWTLGNGRGFRNFLEDMGPRPAGLSLERKNFNGHYEPTNCIWADRTVQANNTRRVWKCNGWKLPPKDAIKDMEARVAREYAESEKRIAEDLAATGLEF
jgi:hypothetical protein